MNDQIQKQVDELARDIHDTYEAEIGKHYGRSPWSWDEIHEPVKEAYRACARKILGF